MNGMMQMGSSKLRWRESSPYQGYGKPCACNRVQIFNKWSPLQKVAVQPKKENWNVNKDNPNRATSEISSRRHEYSAMGNQVAHRIHGSTKGWAPSML